MEFIDCLSEMAQYVYYKYGKFSGTINTIMLPGYVQAVHIETAYYDTHFKPDAYLNSHAAHIKVVTFSVIPGYVQQKNQGIHALCLKQG